MGVASSNVPFTWHGILLATGRGLSVSALKGRSSAPLAFLFCCAGSSRSLELLRCLHNFLWSGGPVQFVTLPGLSLWFFRTCLGFRGTPSDIRVALSCFRMHSSSSPLPRLGVLGDSMLCLFLALGCGVLYFRHGFCDEHSGPSLAPRFAGFTVPAQPAPDNRNGRLLYPMRAVKGYLVRFGYASSAMRAVPFLPHGVTGRSYQRSLSPSGSGCRCHGSPASWPRNGLFRVR